MAKVYIKDNQRDKEILLPEQIKINFGRERDNNIFPPGNYSYAGSVSRHHFCFIRYDVPISESNPDEVYNTAETKTPRKTEPLFKDLTKKIGVEVAGGGFIPKDAVISVIDLSSRNGTYVNDKKIEKETFLKNGDRIRLGHLSPDKVILEYVLRIVK